MAVSGQAIREEPRWQRIKQKEYKAIEELKGIHNTSDAVFEGVKAANGWKTGKMVTVAEYEKAVTAFGKAPIDGREVKK